MCGIAGIIFKNNESDGLNLVTRMTDKIAHRGPDAFDSWKSTSGKVVFGHRRLSIIDLSNAGTQPLSSHDARFTIIFNGEIYNYKELKELCIEKGSNFKTQTDTEVILEMYRHFEHEAFKQFRGMWALCIFDKNSDEIILSRDHFGIKPLYYSLNRQGLFFSSEIPPLLEVDSMNFEIDEITKKLFLEDGVIERGQWTFYKHIKKFPQSCFVKFRINELETLNFQTYWDFNDYEVPKGPYEHVLKRYGELLRESIEIHTRSDVPISATLSGGMDSSSIVSILTSQGHKVDTFSTDFSKLDKRIDESKYVNELCEQLNIPNHKIAPSLEEMTNSFKTVLRIQGEPFGSSSILSQYFVYKKIAELKFKVTIGGQGADETLGGYDFLQRLAITEHNQIRYYLEYITYTIFNKKPPKINIEYYIKSCESSQPKHVHDYLNLLSDGTYEERKASLEINASSFSEYLKYMTLETNLPQLMKYEDRNSMSFSIESRVPFLDPHLVNFSLHLKPNFRVMNGKTKFILRECLKQLLPKLILNRRQKLGFPGPDKLIFKALTGKRLETAGNRQWREFIFNEWVKLNE